MKKLVLWVCFFAATLVQALPCDTNPCAYNTPCINNGVSNYQCLCPSNLLGVNCSTYCDPYEFAFPSASDTLTLNPPLNQLNLSDSFSLVMWARPLSTAEQNAVYSGSPLTQAGVFRVDDFLAQKASDWFFGFRVPGFQLSFQTLAGQSSVVSTQSFVNDRGEWHQYAVTYDVATLHISLFRDGLELTTTMTSFVVGPLQIQSNQSQLVWGQFPHDLDDVRMYQRVLSASELLVSLQTNLYSSVALRLWYTFAERQYGRRVVDNSGYQPFAIFGCNPEFIGCLSPNCSSAPSWCQNGATCLPNPTFVMPQGYGNCSCATGYRGQNCELPTCDIPGGYCFNGGTCIHLPCNTTSSAASTSMYPLSLIGCQCVPPYTGTQCQDVLDPCLTYPCGPYNGISVCTPGANNLTYACSCSNPLFTNPYGGCTTFCDAGELTFPLNDTQLINRGSYALNSGGNVTTCVWSNLQTTTNTGQFVRFETGGSVEYLFGFASPNQYSIQLTTLSWTVVSLAYDVSSLPFLTNAWHLYCNVYDGGSLTLYIDGTWVAANMSTSLGSFLVDAVVTNIQVAVDLPQEMAQLWVWNSMFSPLDIEILYSYNTYTAQPFVNLDFHEQVGRLVSNPSNSALSPFEFVGCPLWTGCSRNCSSLNCANGGTCNSTNPNVATCTCAQGYIGNTCTQRTFPYCTPVSPCQNGGTCSDTLNECPESYSGYTCACVPNVGGVNCENVFTTCPVSPIKTFNLPPNVTRTGYDVVLTRRHLFAIGDNNTVVPPTSVTQLYVAYYTSASTFGQVQPILHPIGLSCSSNVLDNCVAIAAIENLAVATFLLNNGSSALAFFEPLNAADVSSVWIRTQTFVSDSSSTQFSVDGVALSSDYVVVVLNDLTGILVLTNRVIVHQIIPSMANLASGEFLSPSSLDIGSLLVVGRSFRSGYGNGIPEVLLFELNNVGNWTLVSVVLNPMLLNAQYQTSDTLVSRITIFDMLMAVSSTTAFFYNNVTQTNVQSGAAVLWNMTTLLGTWTYQKLDIPIPQPLEKCGYSLSMHSQTLVMGCPLSNPYNKDLGRALRYNLLDINTKSTSNTTTNEIPLILNDYCTTAYDPLFTSQFGFSVSTFENRMAIGAPYGDPLGAPAGNIFLYTGSICDTLPCANQNYTVCIPDPLNPFTNYTCEINACLSSPCGVSLGSLCVPLVNGTYTCTCYPNFSNPPNCTTFCSTTEIQFPSVTDYLASNADLQNVAGFNASSRSICLWSRPFAYDSSGSTDNMASFLGSGTCTDGGGDFGYMAFGFDLTTGNLQLAFSCPARSQNNIQTPFVNLYSTFNILDAWHHYCVTYDFTNGTTVFYFDGQPVTVPGVVGWVMTGGNGVGTIVGGSTDTPVAFSQIMSAVRVWSTRIDAADVRAAYRDTSVVVPSGNNLPLVLNFQEQAGTVASDPRPGTAFNVDPFAFMGCPQWTQCRLNCTSTNVNGTCGLHGTCTLGQTCNCAPGWSGNACEFHTNPCATNPCQNDGMCIPSLPSGCPTQFATFECDCTPGFSGALCTIVAPCQNWPLADPPQIIMSPQPSADVVEWGSMVKLTDRFAFVLSLTATAVYQINIGYFVTPPPPPPPPPQQQATYSGRTTGVLYFPVDNIVDCLYPTYECSTAFSVSDQLMAIVATRTSDNLVVVSLIAPNTTGYWNTFATLLPPNNGASPSDRFSLLGGIAVRCNQTVAVLTEDQLSVLIYNSTSLVQRLTPVGTGTQTISAASIGLSPCAPDCLQNNILVIGQTDSLTSFGTLRTYYGASDGTYQFMVSANNLRYPNTTSVPFVFSDSSVSCSFAVISDRVASKAMVLPVPSLSSTQVLVVPLPQTSEECGRSVSVRDTTLLVGCPLNDQYNTDSGRVLVYRFNLTTNVWSLFTILTDYCTSGGYNNSSPSYFGFGVSTAKNQLLVGAPLGGVNTNGLVYFYSSNICETVTCPSNSSVCIPTPNTASNYTCAIDLCVSTPCQNGGTCTMDTPNSWYCTCDSAYTGTMCQSEVNECASNPCLNGATCQDALNGFTCVCAAGFTGVLCATDLNECTSLPCTNGGVCFDRPNGYVCQCPPGTSEPVCTFCTPGRYAPFFNSTECAPCPSGTFNNVTGGSACQNCLPNTFASQNASLSCTTCPNGFYSNSSASACTPCPPDYTGVGCVTEILQCASQPCQHGATCSEVPGGGFSCACLPGYTGNMCQSDTDECASQPCLNGGTCLDIHNGYTCNCTLPFTGSICQSVVPCPTCNCTTNLNITSCARCSVQNGCCDRLTSCTTNALIPCTVNCGFCPSGYTGNGVTGCVDVNECSVNNGGCSPLVNCTNTRGSRVCGSCPCGYVGNGLICSNINECASNPCQNGGTCLDATLAFNCVCPTGFGGTRCELTLNPCFVNGASVCGVNQIGVPSPIVPNLCLCESYDMSCTNPYTPCLNGGVCLAPPPPAVNFSTCNCPPGVFGSRCEYNRTSFDCLFIGCFNGGTCRVNLNITAVTPNAYYCACTVGYYGPYCQSCLKVGNSSSLCPLTITQQSASTSNVAGVAGGVGVAALVVGGVVGALAMSQKQKQQQQQSQTSAPTSTSMLSSPNPTTASNVQPPPQPPPLPPPIPLPSFHPILASPPPPPPVFSPNPLATESTAGDPRAHPSDIEMIAPPPPPTLPLPPEEKETSPTAVRINIPNVPHHNTSTPPAPPSVSPPQVPQQLLGPVVEPIVEPIVEPTVPALPTLRPVIPPKPTIRTPSALPALVIGRRASEYGHNNNVAPTETVSSLVLGHSTSLVYRSSVAPKH